MQRPRKPAGRHRAYMNIGYSLGEETLRTYFQQFCTAGQVLDVYIPRHNSGRNKGYGFTTFECEEDLKAALQQMEHIVDGIVVKINKAGPRPEYDSSKREEEKSYARFANLRADRKDSKFSPGALPQLPDLAVTKQQQPQQQAAAHGKGPRLYVGGIPDDIAEEQIKAHFMRWGNVVDIYFPGKKGQKRVNYCFVTFDNWRAAERSCNQSERSIDGRPVQSISMAEERTVDSREGQTPRLPHQGSALGPSYGRATGHWTQDLQSYGLLSALQQARCTALSTVPQPALLNYPPAQTPLPTAVQHRPDMNHVDNSLKEQLLLRSIGSGGVADQDVFQQVQQAHADFHAQLQGHAGAYPLPPGALQGLHAGIQNLSLSSTRSDLTGSQLGNLHSNVDLQQPYIPAALQAGIPVDRADGPLPAAGYPPQFFAGQQQQHVSGIQFGKGLSPQGYPLPELTQQLQHLPLSMSDQSSLPEYYSRQY